MPLPLVTKRGKLVCTGEIVRRGFLLNKIGIHFYPPLPAWHKYNRWNPHRHHSYRFLHGAVGDIAHYSRVIMKIYQDPHLEDLLENALRDYLQRVNKFFTLREQDIQDMLSLVITKSVIES